MKKLTAVIITVNLLLLLALSGTARAYWVWTPGTKKFINPKYAVKDTPKEQYDWAMGFYDAKDYQKAAVEFEKLVKNYEYSEYAAEAQYRVGLSYDNQGKYYIAFQNYQKAIDNFPHVSNIDEIIARELNIGDIYASKNNPKVLGADIMTSYDRSAEIYKKVVENAPFGKLADEAQFKMATSLKEAGKYDEATLAFQKILDDYPESKLYDQARYEMANSAYKASLQPAYDAAPTDKALKAFEEFASTNTDEKLTEEAKHTIKRLKNKAAEKSFMTAEFYEKQKHYVSAIIYYQDVIDRFPDSTSAEIAEVRISDLKTGNYSHKSVVDVAAQKKGWTPWFGKDKKAPTSIVVKEATPAPAEAPPAAAVEDKAAETVNQPAPAISEEGQAPQADQGISKDSTIAPVEALKPPAKSRWWSFGLNEKGKGKAKKVKEPRASKVKKSWSPLSFDKKEVAAGKEVKESIKPAEAVKAPADKNSWWSFGLSKKSKDKVEKSRVSKANKRWVPINFDKKTEGMNKDE